MQCPEEVSRAVAAFLFEVVSWLGTGEEHERRRALTQTVRPQAADYPLVFAGESAEQARAWYEALWAADDPVIAPKSGQTEARWFIARASVLQTDPAAQMEFPGGYRDILDRLVPERWWVSWEFAAPGDPYGLQYNGLVWLDGRLAWFPKPWRAFEG